MDFVYGLLAGLGAGLFNCLVVLLALANPLRLRPTGSVQFLAGAFYLHFFVDGFTLLAVRLLLVSDAALLGAAAGLTVMLLPSVLLGLWWKGTTREAPPPAEEAAPARRSPPRRAPRGRPVRRRTTLGPF
ncbi:MAG: hypothetical protein QJR08_04035 [Bacillota bacterium]|nr:hypothetical protein [Bacillota bacterium]